MYLVTSEQMRYFDHYTIKTLKVPGIVLMDHAGKAVAEAVVKRRAKRVVVACGKGNNGGDGWIAARWLQHGGCSVHVVTVVDPGNLEGDAKLAFDMAGAANVSWNIYQPGDLGGSSIELLVDALLGTGCTRPLAGVYEQIVDEMNHSGVPILAIDVPTGIDASTGEVKGSAIRASETIAMAYEKLGTAVTPGAIYSGHTHVVDIGIKAPLPEGMASYVDPSELRQKWGSRDALSHKGTFGRCGIFVGHMQGAAILAAAGAARTGAGLVVLGTRGSISLAVLPDYVVRQAESPVSALEDCQSIVVGPGLGTDLEPLVGTASVDEMFSSKRGVVDADGLKLLRASNGLRRLNDGWVLTPHPKECANLLGWTTEQVQRQRLTAAMQLAERTGAIVLLKGYRTIIATPAGEIRVNPTGNASLAVGGSGDVLAGVIGSLIAQGLNGFDAASLGAWIHGRAGELAGAALTPISTTASDIVDYISRAIVTFFDGIGARN
ncbi:NAD(P)H-hydrate dehydratase [Alicyclobacillus dauci]|uniref:Bifunctional NAD(P)H-hydrate repair enzyme n=1 Tax=Alicyclobacillus dauci TaxID=1475485 RepID=A0ABY6Z1B2_9BACL|nr:NAD(P)H-hydrate dehydratase [Alicyclobacillus dauci]WAH36683.1 NAD(P)H-hydrate dehydratase [Alicyclobacillus dauci]